MALVTPVLKWIIVALAVGVLIVIIASSLCLLNVDTVSVADRNTLFTSAVTNTLLPIFNALAVTVLGFIFSATALRMVALFRTGNDKNVDL